jgi:hypothetical protein
MEACGLDVMERKDHLLSKQGGAMRAVVALCGVLALGLGTAWLFFVKSDTLLLSYILLHVGYLVASRYWKLQDRTTTMEDQAG